MQTTLNLLTRNGVVFTAFKSALSADQYSRLLEIANMLTMDQRRILTTAIDLMGRNRLHRVELAMRELFACRTPNLSQ